MSVSDIFRKSGGMWLQNDAMVRTLVTNKIATEIDRKMRVKGTQNLQVVPQEATDEL